MKAMLQSGLMAALIVGFGFSSGPAQSAPVTVDPGTLSAIGPLKAVFAYKNAGDTSELSAVGIAGTIFNNQTTPVGTVTTVNNVGPFPAPIVFELRNLTQGYSFFTGVADTVQTGVYFAAYTSNFADFGVGALPSATATAIANDPVLSTGPLLFVGFEDRRRGDFDYNDLIFAFAPIGVASIPEPGILALLGLGGVGFAASRRRRK